MADFFFQITSYFRYWLLKEDHFSQQSPFVFTIYQGLLAFLAQNHRGDPDIESIRKKFLEDRTKIQVLDLGAGSKKVPKSKREIRKITQYSTSSPKFCLLYQYFCRLTPAERVIELGTCMGISSRYLAKGTQGQFYTLEGSPEILKASQKFPYPKSTNLILGPIQQTLPELLNQIPKVDFGLIDATHTYEATIAYFEWLLTGSDEATILAVADIHWSPGMEKAWKEIQNHPRVQLTLDFFECGIVFLKSPGEKKHLILSL
ncbi:MAG: class I SAM-dependent methyltransferase [Cyclobacteriaceae bacterium]|nr:class I SAM-dependent methyltransferase [Cyclobacteriaceae bacterium]MDX5466761.1 class I SAM-dependent methyltransferase [Cyclobacteriaceae bacterium]